VECLQNTGFNVWFKDDLTDQHQNQILAGWRRLVGTLAPGGLAPKALTPLIDEVELWARRVAAIEAGALKLYRFYAAKGS